ncbi:MAG TPA: DNA-binding protein Alba [Candidatus Thermoplasmatota archaeon]
MPREPGDKTVYIGRKPRMTYVIATAKQMNDDGEVILKARGKSISQAVDVAEIVRRRYIKDAMVDDIRIATEVLEGEDGEHANVSSIQIFMSRPLDDDGRPPPPVDLFPRRDDRGRGPRGRYGGGDGGPRARRRDDDDEGDGADGGADGRRAGGSGARGGRGDRLRRGGGDEE